MDFLSFLPPPPPPPPPPRCEEDLAVETYRSQGNPSTRGAEIIAIETKTGGRRWR